MGFVALPEWVVSKPLLADGSYDSYLVPDEVRELEAAGEKFYPRELAALVHNESSILAKKTIRDALDRGTT